MDERDLETFVAGLPKAELHVHVEGTLEPELMVALARRNGVPLRIDDPDRIREARRFQDLQSFLDLYYEGTAVLRARRDFHDLAWAYLRRAHAENVRHAELFFDPQAHLDRGVPFEDVLFGLVEAKDRARRELRMSAGLILCFLRHLSESAAEEVLDLALPHRGELLGVGLDSSERGHPPGDFARVFARARRHGLRAVAHAGEEGPAAYVTEALDLLGAERIDHGVRALDDPAVVARLVREHRPLTVCPLSNVCLRVYDRMEAHGLGRLLELGVLASVHSDDPAYFGGYVNANYLAAARALGLGRDRLVALARHSFEAAFVAEPARAGWIAELEAYATAHR